MVGWIGDDKADIHPVVFADADFAGCMATSRSTSGAFMTLRGPDTRFPLGANATKQKCVSHSTTESEIVAADAALRLEGLPSIALWECILQRDIVLTVYEDNEAMIKIMMSGRNPTMRHVGRTDRVSIQWLHELFQEPYLKLEHVDTKRQAADIFTKAF